VRWDPEQYLRFSDERGRPFRDLLARVGAVAPRAVVDLGCGPGNLTRELAARWPGARIEGVDASPEMIARARTDSAAGDGADRITFRVGDLRQWRPDGPIDVIVSNATLQWVPDHLPQLDRLARMLAPGGWLAFQVPGNFDEPTHTQLARLCALPRWRERLDDGEIARPRVERPGDYLTRLAGLGLRADVWETTYLQVLAGDDAVLEWMRGTGLRPVLAALPAPAAQEFQAEYGAVLRAAYPRQDFGTVLPYRRIFAVARRP
jgi:trans-aconitate 2-methyltransferase